MTSIDGIQAMIWDLDGTLADTMPDIVEALRAAACAVGYGELTPEQTKNKVGGGARKALAAVFGEDGQEFVEPAVEHFRRFYPEHCAEQSRLYPGVREVLDHFSGTLRFGLATAKIRPATWHLLAALGVIDRFDCIVTADELQRMKPDPQSIELVLAGLGVAPEATVMVGDMATDVQAGRAAGVHTVGVTYGYGDLDALRASNADALVDSPLELIELIGCDARRRS